MTNPTSPLSPEAVAQMVADLRAADKPLIQSGPFIQTRERLRTAADMLTTLAAENATLRAENEELDFLRHEGGPDSVAAMEIELAPLRAETREAALQYLSDAGQAMDRIATLTEALEELRDLMCEGFEDENGNSGCGMCADECTGCIAHAAITTDKEPKP